MKQISRLRSFGWLRRQRAHVWFLGMVLAVAIALGWNLPAASQVDPPALTSDGAVAATVTLDGVELFAISEKLGSALPAQRAQATLEALRAVASDLNIAPEDLDIQQQDGDTAAIAAGRLILTRVTTADAAAANTTQDALAAEYLQRLQQAIRQYRTERSFGYLLRAGLLALLATAIFALALAASTLWLPRLARQGYARWTFSLRVRDFELLSARQIADILDNTLDIVRFIFSVVLFVVYATLTLSLFPWTKAIGFSFSGYLLALVQLALAAAIGYLPNAFAIFLIAAATHYLFKFTRPLFRSLERGTIAIPGFYSEWAAPTYRLFEIFTLSIAAVLAAPYLPGFGSNAFRGVSIFVGILVSLGSTAAVSNSVAGIILIYTRAFQVGDRIRVGDTCGNVEEKSILVTRIRTYENTIVTIPNALLLSGSIVNFSTSIRDTQVPVMLSASVTLGYDVPWQEVYRVLVDAALSTPYVLPEPLPFVLQTGLGDFSVSYDLKAYTNEPTVMETIYSGLYQNIQDKCNAAGIEILSPTYSAVRDGNQSTIPENYLPASYKPPGFQVNPLGNLFQIDLALGNRDRNASSDNGNP